MSNSDMVSNIILPDENWMVTNRNDVCDLFTDIVVGNRNKGGGG